MRKRILYTSPSFSTFSRLIKKSYSTIRIIISESSVLWHSIWYLFLPMIKCESVLRAPSFVWCSFLNCSNLFQRFHWSTVLPVPASSQALSEIHHQISCCLCLPWGFSFLLVMFRYLSYLRKIPRMVYFNFSIEVLSSVNESSTNYHFLSQIFICI